MAESTRFGRKPKLTKHEAREALKRVAAVEPMGRWNRWLGEDGCMMVVSELIEKLRDMPEDRMAFTRSRIISRGGLARIANWISFGRHRISREITDESLLPRRPRSSPVQQLAAIAAERAAQADGYRGDDRFRLLTNAETEVFLGNELLARLAGVPSCR